jgi:hypothetical protein
MKSDNRSFQKGMKEFDCIVPLLQERDKRVRQRGVTDVILHIHRQIINNHWNRIRLIPVPSPKGEG